MKAVFFVAILLVAAATAYTDEEVAAKFEVWRAKYNKVYATDAEFNIRLSNFAATLERVDRMNAANTTAHFTTTKFADMSKAEFKDKMLTLKNPTQSPFAKQGTVVPPQPLKDTPTKWDWKDQKGTMTWVKDQGQCGSCWAFSITEQLETAWKLGGHNLTELSPQQVVSCDTIDQGCDGGDPATAWQYLINAGGIQTEKDYPYSSGDSGWSEKCRVKPELFVAKVSNFSYPFPMCNDTCKQQTQYEQAVRDAVYSIGPMSICVDASDWQDYDWGIFMGFCGHAADDLDHAVLLTGFDQKGQYYNVRNSWASDWGEDGYIRLGLGDNTCGMLDYVTYATVPKA